MKKSLALIVLLVASTSLHAQELATATLQPPPPPPPPSPPPTMRVPIEARAIKGAPYSAEIVIESQQTLSDGNRIVKRSTGRVYRDSEGRVRREEDNASGFPTVSISDPVAGVSYSLDTERRIAWQTPSQVAVKIIDVARLRRDVEKMAAAGNADRAADPASVERQREEELRKAAAAEVAARRAAEAEVAVGARGAGGGGRGRGAIARTVERRIEEREEGLPSRQIEGVRAEGVRRTSTIPAGEIGNVLPIKIVSEEWTSPDLKMLVLTQHSDPRIGESSYRLLNIIRGDPNPSFFQVPPDYTVRETGIRKMEPLNRP